MKRAAKHRSIWPSILFGLAALGLALISWSCELADLGDRALDISLHDTYYVVPALWPWYTFIGLLLVFAVVYMVLSRWLDSRLSVGHFVLWIPLPLLCFILLYDLAVAGGGIQGALIGNAVPFPSVDTVLVGAATMFMLGGLLFTVNLSMALFGERRSTSNPSI